MLKQCAFFTTNKPEETVIGMYDGRLFRELKRFGFVAKSLEVGDVLLIHKIGYSPSLRGLKIDNIEEQQSVGNKYVSSTKISNASYFMTNASWLSKEEMMDHADELCKIYKTVDGELPIDVLKNMLGFDFAKAA